MFITPLNRLCKIALIPLLLGFPIAVLSYRFQFCELATAFKIVEFTAYGCAAFLILTIFISFFAFFTKQSQIAKSSLLMAIVLALPVLGFVNQALKAKALPFLHQVSTDTVNPPQFQAVVALRGDDSNPLTYERAKLESLQQAAYPELQSIFSELNVEKAFNKALITAQSLGWEVVNINTDLGIIEAVDSTFIWGFKDDVVIRIQTLEQGSQIDLRSISRLGGTDLGANAERIKSFIANF